MHVYNVGGVLRQLSRQQLHLIVAFGGLVSEKAAERTASRFAYVKPSKLFSAKELEQPQSYNPHLPTCTRQTR